MGFFGSAWRYLTGEPAESPIDSDPVAPPTPADDEKPISPGIYSRRQRRDITEKLADLDAMSPRIATDESGQEVVIEVVSAERLAFESQDLQDRLRTADALEEWIDKVEKNFQAFLDTREILTQRIAELEGREIPLHAFLQQEDKNKDVEQDGFVDAEAALTQDLLSDLAGQEVEREQFIREIKLDLNNANKHLPSSEEVNASFDDWPVETDPIEGKMEKALGELLRIQKALKEWKEDVVLRESVLDSIHGHRQWRSKETPRSAEAEEAEDQRAEEERRREHQRMLDDDR